MTDEATSNLPTDPERTCLGCGRPLSGGLVHFCSFGCMTWERIERKATA